MLSRTGSCLRYVEGLSSRSRMILNSTIEPLPGSLAVSFNQPFPNYPSCSLQQRRWTKIKLDHPPSPHDAKRKILLAARPIFAKRERSPQEICLNLFPKPLPRVQRPLNRLEELMSFKAKQLMAESKILVLFHKNPTATNTWKSYRNKVWKLNMRLWNDFDDRIMTAAIAGTKFAFMKSFFETEREGLGCALMTSWEVNLSNVNRAIRSFPSYVPLGIVVDGSRIISYPQLQAFAKAYTGGIAGLHAQTSANLSSAARGLSQSLQYQHVTLSQSLQYLSKTG